MVGDVVPLSAEVEFGGFSEMQREAAHQSKIELVVARPGDVVWRGTRRIAEGVIVAATCGENRLLASWGNRVKKWTLSRNGLASGAGHDIRAGRSGASGCRRGSRSCRVVGCPGLAFAPLAVLAGDTREVRIEGCIARAVSGIGLAGGTGDCERRTGVRLIDAGERKSSHDRPLDRVLRKNRLAEWPCPNSRGDKVLRLVRRGDCPFDAVGRKGGGGMISKRAGGNGVAGPEGASVVDGTGPDVVGIHGQAMPCAHAQHRLESVVIGVADIAEVVGGCLERKRLEESCQGLRCGEVAQARAGDIIGRVRAIRRYCCGCGSRV